MTEEDIFKEVSALARAVRNGASRVDLIVRVSYLEDMIADLQAERMAVKLKESERNSVHY